MATRAPRTAPCSSRCSAPLSPQDAEIVLLRFREELTQDAIARRVGVSQMHVSRVLCRSLVRMRDAGG